MGISPSTAYSLLLQRNLAKDDVEQANLSALVPSGPPLDERQIRCRKRKPESHSQMVRQKAAALSNCKRARRQDHQEADEAGGAGDGMGVSLEAGDHDLEDPMDLDDVGKLGQACALFRRGALGKADATNSARAPSTPSGLSSVQLPPSWGPVHQ